MEYPVKNTITHIKKSLGLPLGVMTAAFSLSFFFLAVSNYLSVPSLLNGVLEALSYFPYPVLAIGIFLSWRYNNTGLVLSSFSLVLMYLSLRTFGAPVYGENVLAPSVCKATLFLFPVNMIGFSMLLKRRIFTTLGSLYLFAFLLQVLVAAIVFNPQGHAFLGFKTVFSYYSPDAVNSVLAVSQGLTRFMNGITRLPCLLVLLWTLMFLFIRYVYKRDIHLAGFSMIFASAMAGMLMGGTLASACVLFTASGALVIIASLEGAFVMSDQDPLTGLNARKGLNALLNSLKEKAVLALVDLDHFNQFNDDYGPDTGDEVLKIVGDKLSDMIKGVRVFRYGGEEFLAVLPGLDGHKAERVLDEFRRKIEVFPFLTMQSQRKIILPVPGKEIRPLNRKTHITVSIGAAAFSGHGQPHDVLKSADSALNKAKQQGRNRVVLWKEDQKKNKKI